MSNRTERLIERRRPFDLLESKVVKLYLKREDKAQKPICEALRYAIAFARLTGVTNKDGDAIDLLGPMALHAHTISKLLTPTLSNASSLWAASRSLPKVLKATNRARASILEHLPIDRDSLEEEVTQRVLAIASGGGGGAGYVYPGCYELLERSGLVPGVMAGTSIGSLMSLFRCRRKTYDFAPLIAASRRLTWTGVFRILETESRYGIPATLRLYLRGAIGSLVERTDGIPMRMSDMEIPLYIITSGIPARAIRRDLQYYEHLLDNEVGKSGRRTGISGAVTAVRTIADFLTQKDALKPIIIGLTPGTEDFDALDAAGFSAAVPGVIHYDVLRKDPRMHQLLQALFTEHGVVRLGEGGLVSNVPAKILWQACATGKHKRRTSFVLALDCFAPSPRRLAWAPIQQLVRTANVEEDRKFADTYVTFPRALSPMNLVPNVAESMTAMRWGRDALREHMPFIRTMCADIPVWRDGYQPRG